MVCTSAAPHVACAAAMPVTLSGYRVEGVAIGIYADEQHETQPVEVAVQLGVDAVAAARSDQVADTVDYAELLALVAQICRSQHFNLLETLVTYLADGIMPTYPRVEGVRITVEKLAAPVPARVQATVRRCRCAQGARALPV